MKMNRLIIPFLVLFLLSSCTQEENTVKPGMKERTIEKRHKTYKQPAITNACNLTISIDPCFNDIPEYMTAFTNAVNMYNSLDNVGINMSIVSGSADIHFDCLPYYPCFGGDAILGGDAGEFYDGDDATNTIYLNAEMGEIIECCGEDFNVCNMTGLIVHEIGHAIGLDHTNSPDGVQIPGTPEFDANSIFNGESFCDTDCSFSAWDIIALRIVHPPCNCGVPPAFTITYDGPTCLNEIETFGISPSFTPQDLEVVEWYVNYRLDLLSSDSQYATVKAIAAGPARVCAKVKNECGLETTECFFFTVMPEVNCEDDGGGGPFPGGLGPK